MFQLETSETVRVMGVGRKSSILPFGRGKVAVGRKTLQLTLQVREGIVVGVYALRHSNHKLVGGGWQENPPTHISSERRVVEGANALQLMFRVKEGMVVGANASVTQITSGRMLVGRQSLQLAFRAREVVVVGRKTHPSLKSLVGG